MAHGENTAVGEGALASLLALSEVEQEVHRGNTAVGWHAVNALTGTLAVAAPTSATAIGSSVINLTGVEALAVGVWNSGTSNTPIIVFRELTAGVTGLETGKAYFVVKGAANSFECSLTHAGAGIKVAGHALETATTKIAILASAEDNTGVGSQALKSLTTGGGNTAIGENAGVNLTSGEENSVVGCEALASAQTCHSNNAFGFRALGSNTTAEGNCAFGNKAGTAIKTGNENTAMGNSSLEANETGRGNTAIGFQALLATKGSLNTALGLNALKAVTTGAENTGVGVAAGNSITNGEENVAVGMNALSSNAKGNKNTAIGYGAGASSTEGEGNIYIGCNAVGKTGDTNQLVIANSSTALIAGALSGTQKLGFFGVTPAAKHAEIKTVSGSKYKEGKFGFETQTELEAFVKKFNELLEACKSLGITA